MGVVTTTMVVVVVSAVAHDEGVSCPVLLPRWWLDEQSSGDEWDGGARRVESSAAKWVGSRWLSVETDNGGAVVAVWRRV